MEMMDVNKLIPHKMNNYFFDDIEGEPWTAFLESIETSGIIEPIVVTQNLIIVSGHQRVRAAKKLGIKEVAVEMRNYDTEDEVLKQLIEANVRQRGITNTNQIKFGRCIEELKRLYGISHGGDRKSEEIKSGNSSFDSNAPKNLKELAEHVGVSIDQIKLATRMNSLPQEVQQIVEDGKITSSTAVRVLGTLSEDEQIEIAKKIAESNQEKFTSQQVKFYKNRIQTLLDENKAKDKEITDLKNSKPKYPDDYEDLKKSNETMKADYQRVVKERQEYLDAMNEAQDKLAEYENTESEKRAQMQLDEDAEAFIMNTYNYIKRNGGFVWVTEKMDNLNDQKSYEFKQAVMAIDAFAKQMVQNIGGYGIE